MTNFFLNGLKVQAKSNETIWEVANRKGINIPHLCHSNEVGYKPDGNCRACVVNVKDERTLSTPSC